MYLEETFRSPKIFNIFLLFFGIRVVTKIIHKKIGVSAEYVKFCRRVFGDENLVEIYRNSAENNIFLAGILYIFAKQKFMAQISLN